MSTLNLKMQLGTLVQLQAVDSQIYSLNEEKKLKPQEIEALKSAFEAKKEHLANLEKAALDLQKEKKDREIELGSKEETTKKLQTQLYQLKTNKEYNTMMQEIQGSKADASTIEDKILECMEKIDKAKNDIEAEKKNLEREEQAFGSEKKKIEARMGQMDERLAQLESERNQITPGLDKKILSQYERILHNRDGLAIVGVKNNTCMGCNMFVPAQVINLIQMYERIITCEVCNRILTIPDE